MKKINSDIREFKTGQLVYACLRRYKGRGAFKLLLHEAQPTPEGGFGYGHGKCWIVSPASLMGSIRSDAKSKASRRNGKKGGRPKAEARPTI